MKAALAKRVRRLELAMRWPAEPERKSVRQMAREIIYILNLADPANKKDCHGAFLARLLFKSRQH